jgi:hypothetical protein
MPRLELEISPQAHAERNLVHVIRRGLLQKLRRSNLSLGLA